MENLLTLRFPHPIPNTNSTLTTFSHGKVFAAARSYPRKPYNNRKQFPPKNLRNPRRTTPPPDFYPPVLPPIDSESDQENDFITSDDNIVWCDDEIEAISSLFQGRIPQKPGKLIREKPLPLPLPHKIRPSKFPTSKKLVRTHQVCSQRQPLSNRIYKNPTFLIALAKEIASLPQENNVSKILTKWAPFIRKGSLSLTIRELGHMGKPERALHVFCWAQNQPDLFPDDRLLSSTVEVLARSHELKMPFELEKFIALASRNVYESMVKGFIKGGNLKLAWKLLLAANDRKRMLDPNVYAKLILELGKNPDKITLALPLLEELAERENLILTQVDCTSVMKVCVKLGKFEIVEALYDWFRKSGKIPSVVMYSMLIHSRYCEGKYREAMGIVWEMEGSDLLFDLPAYRTVIKLFVALDDLSRIGRYFSKIKESGLSPSYDIYRDVIRAYLACGRLAKCRELCREAEMAGFKLDEEIRMELLR